MKLTAEIAVALQGAKGILAHQVLAIGTARGDVKIYVAATAELRSRTSPISSGGYVVWNRNALLLLEQTKHVASGAFLV